MRSILFVRNVGYALAAFLAVVATLWALPASAEDQTVRVTDSGFDPSTLTVVAGDTITWQWVAENQSRHSVRVDVLSGPALEEGEDGPVYDSHPGCSAETPGKCGAPGITRQWTPDTAGTYTYSCRLHPITMRGSLTVDPAPSPDPAAEPTSPNPDPSPSPAGEEKTAEDPDPSPTPTKDRKAAGGSDAESSDSSPAGVTQGTAGSPGGITYGPPSPIDPQPLPTILPSVAPSASPSEGDDPDLETFPTGPPSDDEPGVVAIDAPRGPTPRAVWLGIGGASILASAGAFVKLVLFGAPWA